MRIRKTVDYTDYTYHGKNLVHLKKTGGTDMHFYYDAQNHPSVVNYNGNHYAYVYNLQGDVMALLDNTGAKVVEYAYNAWGKLLNTTGSLASTLGVLNPFRYCAYIYDEETGYYYLRSRYYYPNRGRFINADSLLFNNTSCIHNAFTYANCDPCNFVDNNGTMAVRFLRYASWVYNANMAGAREISTYTFIANGGNIYNAFHEIAQLNVAKQLYGRGYLPTLEQRISGVGEADITAAGMIWEVKPLGTSGAAQLQKYTSASNMQPGEPIVPILDVPIVKNIKMGIISNASEPGVINYYFYRTIDDKEERVESTEVAKMVRNANLRATVTVVVIVGFSLAENFAPIAGGVANDIASFLAALTMGAKCFGY